MEQDPGWVDPNMDEQEPGWVDLNVGEQYPEWVDPNVGEEDPDWVYPHPNMGEQEHSSLSCWEMEKILTDEMFNPTSLLKDDYLDLRKQSIFDGIAHNWAKQDLLLFRDVQEWNDAMSLMEWETGTMTWGGRQWRGTDHLPTMSEVQFSHQKYLITKMGLKCLDRELNKTKIWE